MNGLRVSRADTPSSTVVVTLLHFSRLRPSLRTSWCVPLWGFSFYDTFAEFQLLYLERGVLV